MEIALEVEAGPDQDIVLHHDSRDNLSACAMDSGDLTVVDRNTQEVVFKQEKAHEYQMWYTMQEPQSESIIYTAADDTMFKGWDTRMPDVPIFAIRDHEYGVCGIKPWELNSNGPSNILITGSYDTMIKFWDKRKLSNTLNSLSLSEGNSTEEVFKFSRYPKAELSINKQIWDIKFHKRGNTQIMGVSGVYDGYYLAKVDPELDFRNDISSNEFQDNFTQLDFPEIEGLFYAMDYVPQSTIHNESDDKDLPCNSLQVLTAAFYDNIIRLVNVKL